MYQTPDHGQNILSRGLPKTMQETEYQTGDDGTYEAGWCIGRLVANNKVRYIARTIGADDVVLDRATGLMWAADGVAAGCNNGNTSSWANAITYCNGLNFAGFTDWRLPNLFELSSIVEMDRGGVVDEPMLDPAFFPNMPVDPSFWAKYWSSTTLASSSLSVWFLNHRERIVLSGTTLKTNSLYYYLRAVRKGV